MYRASYISRSLKTIFSSPSFSKHLQTRLSASSSSVSKSASSSPVDDHHHHQHNSHGHDHGHHEPELRKTQTWRHHRDYQSKYERQSEDPDCSLNIENPIDWKYVPNHGEKTVWVPYRTHAKLSAMWEYHAALVFVIWMWWYVFYRFSKEPEYLLGHIYMPDPSQFTDEELGIPPDDVEG
ncbi:unnamed protein product [Didymodactylos carnosus]|uniref:NADH dehydrogenase [ubiquinone] 1 beta subcomplex subunit 2, mitochondrial n=1 Tax=Didymodactylos carnosus TaxID=1234261 RepID=A0A813ZX38_9BILA|nr:unnamed protein product [Didymodactylos carnosus]CAF0905368.1 unnamed protein product [Didymodactylos carnosus]CAF3678809.1 unnamed protein product [Didymodactylos carnosus]CAF3687204.1 unnamed protein product [Didymodactylos carnosus]